MKSLRRAIFLKDQLFCSIFIKRNALVLLEINKLSLGVSKREFVAREANFHKQNYKFQYTVLKLHKSFRLLLQPCSQCVREHIT